MSGDRVIAVVGATGAQGGGLIRAIANRRESGFRARALTRDPSTEAARALANLPNVEVVAADLDDPASIEAAFAGAYGAFCVTFFWADMSVDTELRQAESMAQAARATGVQHVVWSTLEDTRRWVNDDRMPTLQGQYKVPHFDGKEVADQAFRDADVPTTFLRTTGFWENLIYFGLGPQRGADGVLTLAYPMGDSRWPGIASEDIGKIALGIFERGPEYIGKTVSVAGECPTCSEMAEKLAMALGEEVRYVDVDPGVYRGFGFPAADEIGNMFQFARDCEPQYAGTRDLDLARSLNPELQDFDTWLARNADRIPVSPRGTP